jgi:hypothetical protein
MTSASRKNPRSRHEPKTVESSCADNEKEKAARQDYFRAAAAVSL